MGEGLLLTDDLGAGDLLEEAGGAVGDILELELELLPAGTGDVPVDEVVERLGVGVELVGDLLAGGVVGELEGAGGVLGPQVGLDTVPTGPSGEDVLVGDGFAGAGGEVLDAGVQGGVEVAGLLEAEGLGGGLDALVVLARQRVEALGGVSVAGGVNGDEALGGGEQLAGLVAHVGGVVGDSGLARLGLVSTDVDGGALGDLQLGDALELADHVGLAGGVVGALLEGGGELRGGAGADVLLLGDDLELVLGEDLQLVGGRAGVGDGEGDHARGEGGGGELAGVVGEGHRDLLGRPGAGGAALGVLGVVGASGQAQAHGGQGEQGEDIASLDGGHGLSFARSGVDRGGEGGQGVATASAGSSASDSSALAAAGVASTARAGEDHRPVI